MATPASVRSFFESSNITVLLPTDEEYATVSAYYSLSNAPVPLAMVRPRSAEEVSIAVKYAVKHGIQIAVRSKRGDLFGRSQTAGALVIDMRQICEVHLNSDRQTARVGGGCTTSQVSAALAEHGFVTPCSPVPVGYVGWATLGGYSAFSPNFGLGVDQIVAAKLINSNGDLMSADEELLRGLRGGGGNFGVVVELTIKVYPVQKVLGGLIFFESSDIESAFTSYTRGYNALIKEGVPSALGIHPLVVNSDHGPIFGLLFLWSSDDHDLGNQWVEKVAALGKEQMRTVSPRMARVWQTELEGKAVWGTYGYGTSVSVKSITDQISKVIAKNVARLPSDLATLFSWHELVRGKSPVANADSIYVGREPHLVLEILTTVADANNVDESEAWANKFRGELLQCDGVLESDYISLVRPEHTTLERCYGTHLHELRRLKEKYDPQGTFNLTVPRLG